MHLYRDSRVEILYNRNISGDTGKAVFVLKETYVCSRCANHCQVTYEMDGDKLASMDGFLCGSGMTAWITRLLFLDQQTDTVLAEEHSCKQK